MKVKLLEIRDIATCISAIAIETTHSELSDQEQWLFGRVGYGDMRCVLFGRLDGGEFKYDPYDWDGRFRTMQVAHNYVTDNWDDIKSGDVIDVQFILGETTEKKQSDRFYALPKV